MPALPPVANIIKCQLQYSLANATYSATTRLHLGVVTAGPYSAAFLAARAADISSQWIGASSLATQFGTTSTLVGVTVTDLTTTSGLTATDTTVRNGTKVLSGTVPIASTCAVITLRTPTGGRSGRGRIYHPLQNPATEQASPRALNTTYRTQIASAYSSFATLLNGLATPLTLSIVSYFSNKVLRPTPQVNIVNSFTCEGRIDTQRRRLGKRIA